MVKLTTQNLIINLHTSYNSLNKLVKKMHKNISYIMNFKYSINYEMATTDNRKEM